MRETQSRAQRATDLERLVEVGAWDGWSGIYLFTCQNCCSVGTGALTKHVCIGAHILCTNCYREVYADPISGITILFEGKQDNLAGEVCE